MTVSADVAGRKLEDAFGNADFLLHVQGASDEQVVAYLNRDCVGKEHEVRKLVGFLKLPLHRSYIFTYGYGGKMLDALLAARGDRDHWLVRLLTEPVTSSQIREWSAD